MEIKLMGEKKKEKEGKKIIKTLTAIWFSEGCQISSWTKLTFKRGI